MNAKFNESGSTTVEIKKLPSQEALPPRAKRRRFSTAEKVCILALVDACAHGEQGQLLRREGVYASQLRLWRAHVSDNGPGAGKRGPKTRPYMELIKENKKLKKQMESHERKTAKYEFIIEVQAKFVVAAEQSANGRRAKRAELMNAAEQLAKVTDVTSACRALSVPRSSLYRARGPGGVG
jgi:transposase